MTTAHALDVRIGAVPRLDRKAVRILQCPKLEVVSAATRLFEEPGRSGWSPAWPCDG